MCDEKSISGMVESHRSPRFWNFPYLMLNLTLIVKGWIVLAKTGWDKEEALSVGGRKEGTNGTARSQYKLGMQSDSNGMIISSIERKS